MSNVNEIFLPIEGYIFHEVSNYGNIRSKTREIPGNTIHQPKQIIKGRLLKNHIGTHGYCYTCLRGKHLAIHRLVALVFIPNPENKPHVNHINGVKTDNRLENLEWVTRSENELHAHRTGLKVSIKGEKHRSAKLKNDQVLEIFYSKESGVLLAKKYGVGSAIIYSIRNKKKWKHLTANL